MDDVTERPWQSPQRRSTDDESIIDPLDWDWFSEPWQDLGLALGETRIADMRVEFGSTLRLRLTLEHQTQGVWFVTFNDARDIYWDARDSLFSAGDVAEAGYVYDNSVDQDYFHLSTDTGLFSVRSSDAWVSSPTAEGHWRLTNGRMYQAGRATPPDDESQGT